MVTQSSGDEWIGMKNVRTVRDGEAFPSGAPAGELVLSLIKSVHFTVQALEALTQQEAGTPRLRPTGALPGPAGRRAGHDLRTQGEPRSSSWLLLLSYQLCAQTSLRTKCPVRMRLLHG